MARITITASRHVQVLPCIGLLQSAAGLAAADAQRLIEGALRGELQELDVRSDADARLLAAALSKLGAPAQVRPP